MAYTVKRGDTLEKIAISMNIPLADLIAANPQLADPNVIQVGDIINIPGNSSPAAGTTAPTTPRPNEWCCFVLDIVMNRVPEPGVSLVSFPRRHVFVATMGMPDPSAFGENYNIYTAWIASSLSPVTVKDSFDLIRTVTPGFWSNHKNIPSLTSNDFIIVTPETTGHSSQTANPIPVLSGSLAQCR